MHPISLCGCCLVLYNLDQFLSLSCNHFQAKVNIPEVHRSNCRFHHALRDVRANNDFDVYDQLKKIPAAYHKSALAKVFHKSVPVPKCLAVNMQGVGKLFFTLSFILMLFYEQYHLLGKGTDASVGMAAQPRQIGSCPKDRDTQKAIWLQ